MKYKEWKKNGYVVVKNAIPKDVCRVLYDSFHMFKDVTSILEPYKLTNDEQAPFSFSHYGFYGFEALLAGHGLDIVKQHTGIDVLPSYSYARIYYAGSELRIHRDRESCEISATCCIGYEDPWPIGFIDRSGDINYITQEPGDMVIYSGCELFHWRNAYPGRQITQAFLHYVDGNGPNKNCLYDERPALGCPSVRG